MGDRRPGSERGDETTRPPMRRSVPFWDGIRWKSRKMIFGVCSRHVLSTRGWGNDLEAIERKMQGKLGRSGRKKQGEKFRKLRGMTIAISGRARPMSN